MTLNDMVRELAAAPTPMRVRELLTYYDIGTGEPRDTGSDEFLSLMEERPVYRPSPPQPEPRHYSTSAPNGLTRHQLTNLYPHPETNRPRGQGATL